MIELEQVKEILTQKIPGAQIEVYDMTGTQDHIDVRIAWSGFEGKSLIEQHRVVNQALHDQIKDGSIHALSIKTKIKSAE